MLYFTLFYEIFKRQRPDRSSVQSVTLN